MRDSVFFAIGFVVIATLCVIAIALTGCGLVERTSDFIFKPSPKENVPDPGTSSGRLWETIKQTKNNLLTSWAIPIIALGVTVMWLGRLKLGIACIIFGSVNLFMSLATAKFALPMAIFGFVGTMLAVLAGILSKNKAIKDIICNLQDIKQTAQEDNIDLVFQDKIKETLSKQLKSTKKIVKKVKNKLKLKGQMVSVNAGD